MNKHTKTKAKFWADRERTELINTILQQEDMLIEQENIIEQQAEIIKQYENSKIELEKRLNLNSQNSSKPPSSDVYEKKRPPKSMREKTNKKTGGQQGHFGTTLQTVETPDTIEVHDVIQCSKCNHDLSNVKTDNVVKRQVCDIPIIKPVTTEYQMASKRCPSCKTINVAPKAKELKQAIQYGDNIKAIAVYLNDVQHIPLERTTEVLKEMMGVDISEGTLVNMQCEMAEKITPSVEHIAELITKEEIINADETSTRSEGKLVWTHVASTELLTLYYVHTKRGSVAMDEIGVLPKAESVIVHDDFAAYGKYTKSSHALCNAHIIRDLNSIAENYEKQSWAEEMRKFLLHVNKTVEECKANNNKKLPEQELNQFDLEYDNILKEALNQVPIIKPTIESTSKKKRGRQKQHPAKNLYDRLCKRKAEILRFMHDFRVPFTNNQAERDLRMVKLKVKISGGHRSFKGARRHAKIRSYTSTARKQKVGVLNALRQASMGRPNFFTAKPDFG